MLYQLSYPVGVSLNPIQKGLFGRATGPTGADQRGCGVKRYRRCCTGSNLTDNRGMGDPQPLFAQATANDPARVLIIAEIGVNHDGRLNRGLELIHAAADAGADAVKFQWFHPDRLLSKQALLAGYQAGKATDAKDLLEKLALDQDMLSRFAEATRQAGLRLIVTPFSPADVQELAGLDLDAVKIASPDAVNTPLLEAVAKLKKPILISTGTCDLHELARAADLLSTHATWGGGCLLQCVSSYPTPTHEASINGMTQIKQHYRVPVGYSDHTQEVYTGALAVAAGAVVIEKHLTHDRHAPGPDHAASADPGQFAEYARLIRQAQVILGPARKVVQPVEADVRLVSRQSVCLTRDLPAGHTLGKEDLTVMRPGTGIPACELKNLIGQTLKHHAYARTLLDPADLIRQTDTVPVYKTA